MTLLLNLYLGHLLGDFAFQPGWLVAAKRDHATGLLLHIGIIGACTALLLGSQIIDYLGVVSLAMAAHLGIEVLTIRLRASGGLSGLSVFAIDQGLHITSLVALVWAGSRIGDIESVTTLGLEVGTPVLAMACALLAVTFMGAIINHELANSFGPVSMRRVILPYDMPRVYGMVERGASLLLGVLVHPALVLAPFVPRAVYALRLSSDQRTAQLLAVAGGMFVCMTGWAAVALVTLAS